jgi:hypothetical protein
MEVRSAILSLAIALAALLAAGPAPAQLARVDELQVSYGSFVDEFDDGVFPDGGEGEPMLYTVPCGVITDADESGGLLSLTGPDPACSVPNLVADNAAAFFAAAGGLEVTASFVADIPAPDQAYGVIVNNLTGADFATLQVARALIPQDSVVVALVDESFSQLPVALAVLGPAATYIPPQRIELRLTVELAPDGSELVPKGAFRECFTLPCPVPFTPLSDFLGGGGLDPGEFHAPGFLAVDISGDPVPTPFAYEIDSFQVQYGTVVDDFEDGVFGTPVPYFPVNGDFTEVGGALELRDPDPGFGNAIVALDASSPTEVLGSARFRFQLPSECGNYGVSVVDAFPIEEIASLNVVRGVLPGADPDALAVIAQSEAESATQFAPIFAQALISEHPESDPALASVVAIELELSLEEELAPFLAPGPLTPRYRPVARYRLCESADCSGAVFIDLDPAVAVDPDLPVCFSTAAAFAPPPDGGLVVSAEPLSLSLVAAPEPSASLLPTLGLCVAAALARADGRR